jgi:asparagine synthase (glutamine-hydrolysing)
MACEAGVTVMFAGDGGDELFAGNERYVTEKVFTLYHKIPSTLRPPIDHLVELFPPISPFTKVSSYIRKAKLMPIERFFSYQLYFKDHANEYFSDEFRGSLDLDFPNRIHQRHYLNAGEEVDPLNRLLFMDLKLAIADNDLFKVNRSAEIFGVRVVYPYLDKTVAFASARIPARLKLKGWRKRYIFKKAFMNLLPNEILIKKKHGFGLPTGDWLRTHSGFRDLARSLLLDQRSINRGYFRRKALEDLLRRHDSEMTSYFGSQIWNVMMLELWHRVHMGT